MKSKRTSRRALLWLVALLLVQLACAASAAPDKAATAQALADWLAPTASARALEGSGSGDALATAGAEATARGLDIGATQTALAQQSEDRAATSTAFAPIMAELPKYGVDPEHGAPGWIHPPVTLVLEGYQQYDSKNYYIFTIAQDFIVSADITWNTQYGTSGCGFMLRSDGDEEEPSQYMVLATRASTGHVLFMIMAEGEIAGTRDIYARGLDPSFDFHNDATNRLTVVGRDTLFSIYTNETLIGEIDVASPPSMSLPPMPAMPSGTVDPQAMDEYYAEMETYQEEVERIREEFQAQQAAASGKETIFERGFVAMFAMSESGRTICEYENAWLWLIDPES